MGGIIELNTNMNREATPDMRRGMEVEENVTPLSNNNSPDVDDVPKETEGEMAERWLWRL